MVEKMSWFISNKMMILGVGILAVLIGARLILHQEEINFDSLNYEDMSSQIEETISTQEESQLESRILYVDIKGQVKSPGVYQVASGSRVIDAIQLAGGVNSEADVNRVNQAQLLSDQMVVYIPKLGEDLGEINPSLEMRDSQINSNQGNQDKVNINLADVNDLTQLPNIGQKKAEAIIRYRKENGSFQTIEDLMQVSGIGKKTFEGLSDLVVVE